MRESLPPELGLDPELYVPLRLGSTVIGWFSDQYVATSARKGRPRVSVAVMGDDTYEIDIVHIYRQKDETTLLYPHFWYMAAFFNMDIILNMPVGSLDVTTSGSIDYTARSVANLLTTTDDYYRLANILIHARLQQKSKKEFMEAYLDLYNNQYPTELMNEITWRGQALDRKLLDSSGLEYYKLHPSDDPRPYPPPHYFANKEQDFTKFIVMQSVGKIMGNFRLNGKYAPENVLFLEAASDEEYAVGREFFNGGSVFEWVDLNDHKIDPKLPTFLFFGKADDPLAGWIHGTTVPVSEILRKPSQKSWIRRFLPLWQRRTD